jgi:hypothetical protein
LRLRAAVLCFGHSPLCDASDVITTRTRGARRFSQSNKDTLNYSYSLRVSFGVPASLLINLAKNTREVQILSEACASPCSSPGYNSGPGQAMKRNTKEMDIVQTSSLITPFVNTSVSLVSLWLFHRKHRTKESGQNKELLHLTLTQTSN